MTKNASIFDYTTDPAIIEQVVGFSIEKDEYIRRVAPASRACDLLDYADLINDSRLGAEIEETFKDELISLFNE